MRRPPNVCVVGFVGSLLRFPLGRYRCRTRPGRDLPVFLPSDQSLYETVHFTSCRRPFWPQSQLAMSMVTGRSRSGTTRNVAAVRFMRLSLDIHALRSCHWRLSAWAERILKGLFGLMPVICPPVLLAGLCVRRLVRAKERGWRPPVIRFASLL